MTNDELKAIEERWEKVSPIFKDDVDTLLAEVRRLNNELQEAQATIDTHNEMIERQHSEIRRLNELLEMRSV